MTAVASHTPVVWVQSTIDGPIDTVDEAIRNWLNQNGIADLSSLSKEQLDKLISDLQQLSGIPGLEGLIQQLQQLQTTWATTPNSNSLANLKSTTNNQIQLVSILATATTNIDSLDTALTTLNTRLSEINITAQMLGNSTGAWNSSTNTYTVMETQNLLNQLSILESQGVDLNAVGLGTLRNQLQTALTAYRNAIASNPTAPNELALSDFREAVARAKLNYYHNTLGLSSDNPQVLAEQSVIDGEELWQSYLTATEWNASLLPPLENLNLASINQNLEQLRLCYQFAQQRNESPEVLQHINAKIEILQRAAAQLQNGDDPNTVGITLVTELMGLEIAELTRLENNALQNNNKTLADRFKTQREALIQIKSQVYKSYSDVLDKWAGYYNYATRS